MVCRPAASLSELDFAHALFSRDEQLNTCTGKLILMEFWSYQVFLLEEILDSEAASYLLWDGFPRDGETTMGFELCCAHWFDLAVLTEFRAAQHGRRDWAETA